MPQAVEFEERKRRAFFSDGTGDGLAAKLGENRSTGNRKAPQAETGRSARGWLEKIAAAFARTAGTGNGLELVAKHQLSKGWTKRMYLAQGARISCSAGKVWITLDKGGEDIVLAACESKSFGRGTRLLIEALAPSRISLEPL